MPTTVYLVRHAEAEGNVYRRCHGQYDSLLTMRGEAQLPYLAKRFAEVPLDAVYASDLYRARLTARAIAAPKGLPVQVRPVLREICMGEWEDMSWAELARRDPEAYRQWQLCPWKAAAPGGESILQSGGRMLEGLRGIVAENPDAVIAVVAHGSVIRGALSILMGLTPLQLPQLEWGDNTCVTLLEFQDSAHAKIIYRNDVRHLPPELQTFRCVGWRDPKCSPAAVQAWFRPVELQNAQDREMLLHLAAQQRREACGSDHPLDTARYLDKTARQLRKDAHAVMFGMLQETPVALVQLDVCDGTQPDTGVIGGMVLDAAHRGQGLSRQLLGEAISFYRRRGKRRLCAYVAEKYTSAQEFCRRNGFIPEGEAHSDCGRHIRLVKSIEVKPYRVPAKQA